MSDATYEGRMPTIDDFCDLEQHKEMFPNFPYFQFTPQDFQKARSRELLYCKCTKCGKIFSVPKNSLQRKIKHNKVECFCSTSCQISWKNTHSRLCPVIEKKPYVCETCGKQVSIEDYYGSGRFCSKFCYHSAVAKISHTKEVRNKISQSIKTYYQQQVFNKITINFKVNKITSIDDFIQLTKKYNFSDLAYLLDVSRKKIVKIAKSYNISEPDIFLNSNAKNAIKACRNALNKSIEDGSITIDDFETVRHECSRLMFEEEIPSIQVCREYLGIDNTRDGQFVKDVFHIQLPSLKEIGRRRHAKSIINKTEREKYYDECKFKFPNELLPYTKNSNLIGYYPWYNPFHPKDDGLTKDHMISKKYGYKHNIDTYLISHPANCEIMLLSNNASKQDKCSLTVEELIERVEWWNENIIHKIFNDFNK